MSEQELEKQILDELEQLKVAIVKFKEAETAYLDSVDKLEIAINNQSVLVNLWDDFKSNEDKSKNELDAKLANWDNSITKKMDYFHEEISRLKIIHKQELNPALEQINIKIFQHSQTSKNNYEEFVKFKNQQILITYIFIFIFVVVLGLLFVFL
jgi:hypothetical protein